MASRYWVGGAGTWDASSTANWSATSGGASGASAPTSADDVFFDSASSAGSYTVTTASGMTCRNLSMLAPATGTVTFSSTANTLSIYGDVVRAASGTSWGVSAGWDFKATSGIKTIELNGTEHESSWVFDGVGGTWQFQSDTTLSSTRNLTLTNGTLDLNDFTITAGRFLSATSAVRHLDFGTGKIVITANNSSIFTFAASNMTVAGSRTVELAYTGATGTRTLSLCSSSTESNALDLYVLGGTDTVALSGSAREIRELDFSGFAGTFTNSLTTGLTVFGDLTLASGMTISDASTGFTFDGSGTQTVTTNGKTIPMPWTVDANVTFADALTFASGKTFSLTGGTVTFLAGSTNTADTFSIVGNPSVTLQSSSGGTQYTFSQASGRVSAQNMTVSDSNVTGGAIWEAFTHNANVDGGNNDGWSFSLGNSSFSLPTLPQRRNEQVSVIKVLDGPQSAIFHIHLVGNGISGELTDEVLIDPSVDFHSAASSVPTLSIDQIWYDLSGFNARLNFDYLVSGTPVWTMSGGQANNVDFSHFGGLKDRSNPLDGTGKLMLSTSGFISSGDAGMIILKIRKD